MRLARTRRWLARLPRRAQRPAPDVEVFESAAPFAFAAGLRRPRVFLAASLVEGLPGSQLAAVIEHERAHARRRDPLARLAARVLSFAHLPGLRRTLLRELAIASEQACDAEAGRRVGDRLAVAEAILAVERILSSSAPARAGIAGFEGHSVAERVRALLAAEPPALRRRALRIAAALALAAGLALADPLHHATEHFLALVTHLLLTPIAGRSCCARFSLRLAMRIVCRLALRIGFAVCPRCPPRRRRTRRIPAPPGSIRSSCTDATTAW